MQKKEERKWKQFIFWALHISVQEIVKEIL
jgi:hypothetical protein